MSRKPKTGRQVRKPNAPPRRNGGRKTLLLIGALVVIVGAVGFPIVRPFQRADVPPGATAPVSQATLSYGEEIYRANCAVCHGEQGEGHVFPAAPALNGSEHSWHHPDFQIIQLLREGGVQMPAVAAGWSDQDVEAVITYFKQWWSDQQRTSQRGLIGE